MALPFWSNSRSWFQLAHSTAFFRSACISPFSTGLLPSMNGNARKSGSEAKGTVVCHSSSSVTLKAGGKSRRLGHELPVAMEYEPFDATPNLTSSTLNTPSDLTSNGQFVETPSEDANTSNVSSSFIMPSSSFEIRQYTNLRDVVPEWDDNEVDEILILSPKTKSRVSVSSTMEEDNARNRLPFGQNLQNPHISEFKLLQALASLGPRGNISLAKHQESNKLFVIKTLNKAHLSYDTPVLEQVMTEQMILRLLTQMDLPFVIKLRWSFQDKEALYLAMDFCSGGDVQTFINHSGPLSPSHARFYAAELVEALLTLHTSGIIHRAIEPSHILIGHDGHLILTGFSHSSVSSLTSPELNQPPSVSPRLKYGGREHSCLRRGIEGYEWSSPEIILGWMHDSATDCWGFAMVVFYMLTGRHPFIPELTENLCPHILEPMILHAPLQLLGFDGLISLEAGNLILACLQRNPRLRLGMDEIKEHDYFSNTDWKRLRARGYTAPLDVPSNRAEHDLHNSEDIGSSDTLSGVHITGFDFINEDPKSFATMEYIGQTSAVDTSDTSTEELEDTGVCVPQEINDGAEDPTLDCDADNQCGKDSCISTSGASSQESKERPSANVLSDSVSVVSNNSTSAPPSASTALYSCTSFGELREAMKTNLKSSSPPLNSKLDLKPAIVRNRKHNHMGLARLDSGLRPTGIMLRPRNDVQMLGATQGLTGVGARGLGIRKYASLNFDLDTIVSLDSDLDGYGSSSADQDVDLNSSAVSSFRMMTPTMERRRVSFVDSAFNSGTVGHGPQTPSNSDGTALKAGDHPKENQSSPSWMNSNLGRYTSPTMNGNGNKLRKRRNMSTPVLLNTPHLQEKVELPAGLEQIGMGIGYTYNRPRVVRPTMAVHVDGQLRTGTPRRSVSLGSSVARCGALLTNFTRGRTNQAENLVLSPASTDRTSEESETIDPMMREVYGPRWGVDFGLGPLVCPGGAGGAPLGAGTLRGRVPGRVYSVDENANESGMDSTLRLVDSVQREEF